MKLGKQVNEELMLPRYRPRRWSSRGLTAGQERTFNGIAVALIVSMIAGWSFSAAQAFERGREPSPAPVTRQITSALLDPRATSTAFVSDKLLEFAVPFHGESGGVHIAERTPGASLSSAPGGNVAAQYRDRSGEVVVSPDFTVPEKPGIYDLAVKVDEATRPLDGLSVITLVPFSEKNDGHIGLYYLGSWPFESGGRPKTKAYANPSGFIEVTPENKSTHVSDHFQLGDFLTKGQNNVWPKYLLLEPRLLDKLELIIDDLEAHGHKVQHVQIMSGFRTPGYNEGGGNTAGRANLSRHMYGDASDVFVDNDRNGVMDDLNGDGRVNERDAEVIRESAERVEQKYPALVGGVGVYVACCGHGPFTHIDVRGYRARWKGTGNG